MPYDVPVENAIGVAQAVYETDSVREMLKNYVAEDEDIEVELPDYEHLEKPLVEVFTLDSATCAACTYMMGAANEVKKTFGDLRSKRISQDVKRWAFRICRPCTSMVN